MNLCKTCGHSLVAHRASALGDCMEQLGPTQLCQCREFVQPTPTQCPECGGVSMHVRRGCKGVFPERVAMIECPECGGEGRIHSHNDYCNTCHGKKRIPERVAPAPGALCMLCAHPESAHGERGCSRGCFCTRFIAPAPEGQETCECENECAILKFGAVRLRGRCRAGHDKAPADAQARTCVCVHPESDHETVEYRGDKPRSCVENRQGPSELRCPCMRFQARTTPAEPTPSSYWAVVVELKAEREAHARVVQERDEFKAAWQGVTDREKLTREERDAALQRAEADQREAFMAGYHANMQDDRHETMRQGDANVQWAAWKAQRPQAPKETA